MIGYGEMEIMTLKYGESSLPESMIFVNGHTEKKRNIIFNIYLIRENNKMILVDAGCETMPGFVMKNFIGPIKALKNINVDPEEITDVIITHSHHDHIECVKYFKNAVIHIENSEYQHGKKYIPGNFVVNKFIRRFTICEDVTVIKIGGHSKGSCIVEVKKSNKMRQGLLPVA